jgi:hypothetical protein
MKQMAWEERLKMKKEAIQFRHVVSNALEVLEILKNHNFPLALAGHYHFQQKVFDRRFT